MGKDGLRFTSTEAKTVVIDKEEAKTEEVKKDAEGKKANSGKDRVS